MAAEFAWICKRTVVSAKAVQAGKFCNLSVLDRIMENNHLRIVFYYRTPKERKAGESIKLLRDSISEALCAYPIVTGRMLKNPQGQWMIKCNDAGVRLVESRVVKGSVEKWLQNLDREKELKLVYWEPLFHKPYFWSTFYVQLTEFEEGGLAIGLSCTHLLSDPICATMFIKAWADMTLCGKMVSPPLYHPLPQQQRPTQTSINRKSSIGSINHYKSALEKLTSPPEVQVKHTTISLAFKDDMVRSCISMAKADDEGSSDLPRPPTPFEALAGLLWICISKIKARTGGLINMSVCLDMRKVLSLEKGFFGNCMVYNEACGEGIKANEFPKAVAAVREVVDRTESAEEIMDLIGWLEAEAFENPPPMNGCTLVCANLEEVDSYSAIFYDNFRPIRASYYIEPTIGEGMILVLPSPSGDEEGPFSRVIMITLPEDEALELLEDKLIQNFSPTILMMADKN